MFGSLLALSLLAMASNCTAMPLGYTAFGVLSAKPGATTSGATFSWRFCFGFLAVLNIDVPFGDGAHMRLRLPPMMFHAPFGIDTSDDTATADDDEEDSEEEVDFMPDEGPDEEPQEEPWTAWTSYTFPSRFLSFVMGRSWPTRATVFSCTALWTAVGHT
jgi:hypothetical protein